MNAIEEAVVVPPIVSEDPVQEPQEAKKPARFNEPGSDSFSHSLATLAERIEHEIIRRRRALDAHIASANQPTPTILPGAIDPRTPVATLAMLADELAALERLREYAFPMQSITVPDLPVEQKEAIEKVVKKLKGKADLAAV